MLKLYRKSQEAQLNWIREHKLLWFTSNVILTAALIWYMEYRDRREMREIENEIAQENQ